jgi:unsaturated chondroitin disaccharide hydrolase
MMKKVGISCFMILIATSIVAQSGANRTAMKKLIDQDLRFAVEQYKVLMNKLPSDVMPQYYNSKTNQLVTSKTSWWCSGFYPGTLWYLYEYSGDASIKAEAEKKLQILEKEKNNTHTHDLGFMMFCSFGNAYRLSGNPAYKEVLNTSAASLSTRYRPIIKSIQSWDSSKNFKCPVIIDNMMNLELLNWVSDNGGDPKYKDIAINHANTTIRNHYRPDFSSFHVVDYDLKTGNVLRKKTWQGAADTSAWSRGQAWGLYGFTTMYRFTKDKRYLRQARNIAGFILNNPNLPKDLIPYWDFNAPDIPTAYRDASAAAIIASALLELGKYVGTKERSRYGQSAIKIIQSLSSANYLAKIGDNGGFLLMHSVGSIPAKAEIDVPLTYADYYFVEALLRYKKWYL